MHSEKQALESDVSLHAVLHRATVSIYLFDCC